MSLAWRDRSEAEHAEVLAARNLPSVERVREDRAGVWADFADRIFGQVPEVPPVRWSRTVDGLVGQVGDVEIRPRVHLPVSETPFAAFLLVYYQAEGADELSTDFWPVDFILERGFAAIAYRAQDVDPDFDDGFQNGIHGVAPGDWGTIAAWAWGASRVLDGLALYPEIDPSRVAVVGHSRAGKTALWAGACDERFAMVVSNNSGCTGAALSRGNTGEQVADIQRGFPHWFCARYRELAGRAEALPVDQHQLLALIAPRALYVASAEDDAWADPEGEFLATVAAQPAFGRPIGYHLRPGPHALTRYDWERYLDFAADVV